MKLNISYLKNRFLQMSLQQNNIKIIHLILKMINLSLKVNLEENLLKGKMLLYIKNNNCKKIRMIINKLIITDNKTYRIAI